MSSPTGVNHDDMIQDALLLTSLKGDESSPKKARKHSSTDELVDIRESLKSEEQDEKIIDLTTLPDPKVDCNPDDYLRQLVHSLYNIEPKVKKAIDLGDYFPEITDEQVAAYDILVVSACRENDVDRLKALHAEKGMSVSCCNRFGESLLHMACRRGFREMGQFLLEEANVSVRIRDDCGRTPLHDVCWNPQPQVEMAEALVRKDPSLLLISDKRGSTPFQYSRPQHWPVWRQFVFDHRELLKGLLEPEQMKIFCS
jgi:Ankyrin repeats (3 copies)